MNPSERLSKPPKQMLASRHRRSARLQAALPDFVGSALVSIRHHLRVARAERAVARFSLPDRRPHNLPGELVVSLTSYPPRFSMLGKTLRSLLMQTVQPDRTILWVSSADRPLLPAEVLELEKAGLEIRSCEDLRSYKKVVPALQAFPTSYLVTADDDLYYSGGWLETILTGFVPGERVIVCRRAHRPSVTIEGFAPYASWDHDILTEGRIEEGIFPTSGAGALYPPGSLAPEVCNKTLFQQLCPDADDVWLFVMALRAKSRFRQVGGGFAQVSWEGSQRTTLLSANLSGGNDRQLAAVLNYFEHID